VTGQRLPGSQGREVDQDLWIRREEITDSADQEQNEAAEDERVAYFPILSVFDISQTNPIDPDDDPLTIGERRLIGEDPDGIADAVADYLTGKGWSVDRRTIQGADGFTDPQTHRVVIEASLSPADTASTLLHEAAHVTLHAEDPAGQYQQHRGIKETEAESVAYVVAGLFGLNTSPTSISYVTGWSNGDTDAIRDTAARVLQAVRILSEGLMAEETEYSAP
jgi:hypothetical protein